MAKKIVIPTDYWVRSLNLVRHAMDMSEAERVRIILLYGIVLTDSITEMLFFSKWSFLEKVETREFVSSCKLLHNKYYSRIESISVDIFTGLSQAAFNNYLDGNGIEEAYVPTQYSWQHKDSRCVDLLPYFEKCKLPCREIRWEESVELTPEAADQLETLFFPQQN